MTFRISKAFATFGSVRYSIDDYSVQTIPPPRQAGSVLVNDVELLLGCESEVVGISGYCPYQSWRRKDLCFPASRSGGVICDGGVHPDGISVRLNKTERWSNFHDPKRAILCICPGNDLPFSDVVIGFDGFGLCIGEGRLNAIWLHFAE
jgi:hypothetical protein